MQSGGRRWGGQPVLPPSGFDDCTNISMVLAMANVVPIAMVVGSIVLWGMGGGGVGFCYCGGFCVVGWGEVM